MILTMRFRRKLTCMCGNINNKEFLVLPLRPAHVLTDDYVFLIMDIVLVTRMTSPSLIPARPRVGK